MLYLDPTLCVVQLPALHTCWEDCEPLSTSLVKEHLLVLEVTDSKKKNLNPLVLLFDSTESRVPAILTESNDGFRLDLTDDSLLPKEVLGIVIEVVSVDESREGNLLISLPCGIIYLGIMTSVSQ